MYETDKSRIGEWVEKSCKSADSHFLFPLRYDLSLPRSTPVDHLLGYRTWVDAVRIMNSSRRWHGGLPGLPFE